MPGEAGRRVSECLHNDEISKQIKRLSDSIELRMTERRENSSFVVEEREISFSLEDRKYFQKC